MFGKKLVPLSGMIITVAVMSTAAPTVMANDLPGYWTTKSGEVWRNGFEQCYKTRFWKPENAIAECEGAAAVDSDADGIADSLDACPKSHHDVVVDSRGCELDSDKDGVVDRLDRCADTPPDTTVDTNGCLQKEADSDGDGIVDSKDRCPGTASGTTVNASGCARDGDADADGIVDSQDRCANTPAGTRVNATGCERDDDGDGIVNSLDRCPNTGSGSKVDIKGCELHDVIVLKGVNFETSSDLLKAGSSTVLDEMAATLKLHPEMVVEVAGYTDSQGAASLNKALSQQRAVSVANYLASKGVASSSLQARGYGEASPIADNNTAAGRAKNRRVELHIIQQ